MDYCFRFKIRPAAPRHWPYSLVSSQHAILDDDVEVAPIYRYRGIEWEAERPESHHKQSALAQRVPISGSLTPKARILGMQ